MRPRRAEKRHDAIALYLVDNAIVAMGSPKLSIRPVEFRMSANSTVRRLNSPPLMLSSRNSWLEFSGAEAACSSALPQWPQKRLLSRDV
jgi:hypothetical protein